MVIIRKIRGKLSGSAGETLVETLVALLLSSIALVMLAGAVNSSARIVKRSRAALMRYYDRNESAHGVIKTVHGCGTEVPGGITLEDAEDASYGGLEPHSFDAEYFVNDVLGDTDDKKVIAYTIRHAG